MMSSELDQKAYQGFFSGDIWAKWDAARQLMATRQMQTAAARSDFERAFLQLGDLCVQAKGVEQLLAIALAIRISELVKGTLRTKAAAFLQQALLNRPASLRMIGDSRQLPKESKASEIRENIALALGCANGDWVLGYLVEAIGWEDRSVRCRLELFRQLLIREPRVSKWLEMLSDLPWPEMWAKENPDRAGRLRDLTTAMSEIIRSQRNIAEIDENAGPALSALMQKVVVISPRGPRPTKLADASGASIDLLDEMLATEFTLIPDPEAYAPLAVVARWWQSQSYPPQVFSALSKIARRIKSAIRLRARMGQRSEMLILRLRQALGTESETSKTLVEIAENEQGLNPDVDDWLRGNIREESSTAQAIGAILSDIGDIEMSRSIAPLMLDCMSARMSLGESSDPVLASEIRRLCSRVDAISAHLKLKISGEVGNIVEFNRLAHRTIDDRVPNEPSVRVVRPMVIRTRGDGSEDVLERAVVKEIARVGGKTDGERS